MTDHTYAGYTAEQIRAAAEAAEIEAPCPWRTDITNRSAAYIVTVQPTTVLALLDRIAELEAGMPAARAQQKNPAAP
ncbi:hypothetical protein DFO50_109122 [Microvirgula sp. AG722]|uniref:hypothetical protein n=1 Tax=Microvirgula sp. AG722 TaxID=2183901 RepID=UPI000DC454ED|nr:hypothetical protein [Microvirgula sp. AG722]RAS14867.1 hypothetical protein DFO50_109122 [Microvirgula sp. AG722]